MGRIWSLISCVCVKCTKMVAAVMLGSELRERASNPEKRNRACRHLPLVVIAVVGHFGLQVATGLRRHLEHVFIAHLNECEVCRRDERQLTRRRRGFVQALYQGRLRLDRPAETASRAWQIGYVQDCVESEIRFAVVGLAAAVETERGADLTFRVSPLFVILVEDDTDDLKGM